MTAATHTRTVFAGTPEFALPGLRALDECGSIDLVAVLTQPDRRRGRGRRTAESPVKSCARELGLEVLQFERLLPEAVDAVARLRPRLIVVAAYGIVLPPNLLEVPDLGCVNIHASLLPRWRGAAPVARAIEAGDPVTGVSIMQMSRGLDEGAVYSRAQEPIRDDDTAQSLQHRLAVRGAQELMRQLPSIIGGTAAPVSQTQAGASYARKLVASEAFIDWSQSARQIERKIRAFVPWPRARTWLGPALIFIDSARLGPETVCAAEPGTVVKADPEGIVVAAGQGCISILRIQREGKKSMPAASYLAGSPISPGMRMMSQPQAS